MSNLRIQCPLFRNYPIFFVQKQFLLLLRKNFFCPLHDALPLLILARKIKILAKTSSFSRSCFRLLRARYPTQMITNRMGIRQASTMPLVMPA
ncbi:hypothetical protein ALC56_09136 [Trachymyrmex septentrionalis]|uniref:Uncharacterized protein n=1 Tax=Trachymyrmex septentrionalis TaxID=34720 RepID=A0A151JUM3_9HYME|nr:hypothetical protein ALC56_09136 [Trachymyrmex septentrionalis]